MTPSFLKVGQRAAPPCLKFTFVGLLTSVGFFTTMGPFTCMRPFRFRVTFYTCNRAFHCHTGPFHRCEAPVVGFAGVLCRCCLECQKNCVFTCRRQGRRLRWTSDDTSAAEEIVTSSRTHCAGSPADSRQPAAA